MTSSEARPCAENRIKQCWKARNSSNRAEAQCNVQHRTQAKGSRRGNITNLSYRAWDIYEKLSVFNQLYAQRDAVPLSNGKHFKKKSSPCFTKYCGIYHVSNVLETSFWKGCKAHSEDVTPGIWEAPSTSRLPLAFRAECGT